MSTPTRPVRWNDGLELNLPGLPSIVVDPAVPVMALVFTGHVWGDMSRSGLAAAALIVPVLVLSALAHELGHALVARRWGLLPVSIRLHASGGLATFAGQMPSRAADRQVTLAGPLANLLIGLACLGVAALLAPLPDPDAPWSEPLPPLPIPLLRAMSWCGWANLALVAINLMPAMPLDGGHLAYSLLERRLGPERALFWVGLCGVVAGVALWPVCLVWVILGVPVWLPPSVPLNWAVMRRAAAKRA